MGAAATALRLRTSFIDKSTASSDMDVHQFVAALVQIRGVDRLEGALMTRCWLEPTWAFLSPALTVC